MPARDQIEIPNTPAGQPLLGPAHWNKLYPHNIVFVETQVLIGTQGFYSVGFDIDAQQFIQPDVPEYRFFRASDPYRTDPYLGNNFPIVTEPGNFTTKKQNVDPGVTASAAGYPWQGNVRYRHGDQRPVNLKSAASANFAFADGHVERMTPNQVKRYMFMIKWPVGVKPTDGLP